MQDPDGGNGTWSSDGSVSAAWNPAGVVGGTGLTLTSAPQAYNSPAATPELAAAICSPTGITVVIDYTLTENVFDNTPRIQVEVADAGFFNEWSFLHDGDHHIDLFSWKNRINSINDSVPTTAGINKVAVTLSSAFLGYSLNGAIARIAAGIPDSVNMSRFWFHVGIAHGTGGPTASTVTVRSIRFYSVIPADMLPQFSK